MVRSVLTAASILPTDQIKSYQNDFSLNTTEGQFDDASSGVTEGQFDDAGKLNHETVSGIFKKGCWYYTEFKFKTESS